VTPLDSVAAAAEALGMTAWLVGGPVRDHLRGKSLDDVPDLDVVVEGDARVLARALPGEVVIHERFGTATWRPEGALPIDLVTARREAYAAPGALPDVEPADIEADLRRRDFTVNAMAYKLRAGGYELRDPLGGRRDLEASVLRVLHDDSFVDDPTRLLRGARYAARLGLTPDPHTRALIAAAVAGGALSTVSPQRRWHEWERTAAEVQPADAAALWVEWGIAAALGLPADVSTLRRMAGSAGSAEGAGPAVRLAAWLAGEGTEAAAQAFGLGGAPAARLARRASLGLATALEGDPVDAAEALAGAELGEVAVLAAARPELLGALRAAGERVARPLPITGRDLLAAGIAPGAAIGVGLRAARRAWWRGDVHGAEQALAVALAAAHKP